jgi:hypothetical protein
MGRLHVIYRSYGGENTKSRPPYYSKVLALMSLLRAAEEAREQVDLVFLNNGWIPPDRLAIMRSAGEVMPEARLGGNEGSFRKALAIPRVRKWSDDDLVWFAEDDYLYDPRALAGLLGAATAMPEADYLALYASIGFRPPFGGDQPDYAPVPAGWRDGSPVLVGDRPWRRALSTTSSFGARVAALRADERIFWLSTFSRGAWDHTTCLIYQGFLPFPWQSIGRYLWPAGSVPVLRRVKWTALAVVKAGLNVWSAIRPGARRILVAADPPLATHLESAHLALGTDWTGVARDTACWASGRGVPLSLPAG